MSHIFMNPITSHDKVVWDGKSVYWNDVIITVDYNTR